MQDYAVLAEKMAHVIKRESPAFNSVLKDIGIYTLFNGGFRTVYQNYGKQLSLKTIALMAREVYINDERVTNTMAVRPELIKTKCMLKTDFSLILAESLGIGRNKSQEFIDSFISCGEFVIVPNILDTNAKMIKPKVLHDEELTEMYKRICAVNGEKFSQEEFEKFRGNE